MTGVGDTSAWVVARRDRGELRRAFATAVEHGQVLMCDPVRLELLRGARSAREVTFIRAGLGDLPEAPAFSGMWPRAAEVVELLAALPGGRHRRPGVADLLIAAIAEAAGQPVLHQDGDFELIASVTGQPQMRLLSA